MPFFQPVQLARIVAVTITLGMGLAAAAEPMPALHAHHHGQTVSTIASTPATAAAAETYAAMIDDAMNHMNAGMVKAPMNGDPDHDFAAMMIPHHQGAVDMAKAELLYGKNPILRRLAQEIIVSQDQEIQVMQGELHPSSEAKSDQPR